MKNKPVNLIQLEAMAEALGDLLGQMTFVGGCTTVLLVDRAAQFASRKTDDVDVIVDVATRMGYYDLSDALKERGFREDQSGPICRWRVETGRGEIKLDVMPVNEEILGFSNRWYPEAIRTAWQTSLSNGVQIKVVNPVYFLATKFEAFAGRGQGDFFSHDIEDIVFVFEHRTGLISELMDSPQVVKQYFSSQATMLLNDEFLNILPGLLDDPASSRAITNVLRIMKNWGG